MDFPTFSLHIGLVVIEEVASKECGAITVDLLHCAGVLDEADDGSWDLAEGWELCCIYIYGDAKTIENMVKSV